MKWKSLKSNENNTLDKQNILNTDFKNLKKLYDEVLNVDKSTYKSSNDEPTPIDCVIEMVDKLPISLFKNKDLRILDPCCGNGNFHLVIYKKLKEMGYKKKEILNKIFFPSGNMLFFREYILFIIDWFPLSMKIQSESTL